MINKEIMFTVDFTRTRWRVVCETETWVSYNGWVFNKPESGWIYPRHWGQKQYKACLSHEYLSYVISEIKPTYELIYTARPCDVALAHTFCAKLLVLRSCFRICL